jgi:hypothetical protein
MSIPLLTLRQADLIVSNVAKVVSTGNSEHLSNSAYRFLYLSSGFIAHFNLHGFRAEYSNVADLKNDILRNQRNNQWNNFRPGEANYQYYMQKKDIYNRICKAISNGSEDNSFTDPIFYVNCW